jgi:BirA family biotin operon repressor/biotin-[acetyl-CoA-carboxylase] ligase
MRSPLDGYELLVVEQALSTQDLATAELLNPQSSIGAVLTPEQIAGRGRFKRPWITPPGEALTVSLLFRHQANHPAPHLLGMAVAIATAGAVHAKLQWPNDLVSQGKKVGGILTEMQLDSQGNQVAVVGLGLNLNQTEFPPEIADRATSLRLATGQTFEAQSILSQILGRLQLLPEPALWSDLAPVWNVFDDTPGKRYVLPSGTEVIAIGIGSQGELIATDDGTPLTVMAADAIFGNATAT